MNIEIRCQDFKVSEAMRAYTERRLNFALRKFAGKIGSVMVRFSDVNGPRGGADKLCRISAEVPPWRAVSMHAINADLYAAIDRAAARIERSLARQLRRRRDLRRGRISIRKPSGSSPGNFEAQR